MDNVIGQPFDDYVDKQIGVRQISLSKHQKSADDLVVFNSSTPWIRLSSSVLVEGSRIKTLATNLGLSEEKIEGPELAKNLVLFAGTSDGSNLSNRKGGVGYGLESSYGFLSDREQGYRSMPGITNISATYKNNGTLKQAQVNLKCFTRKQFEAIEAIYLRLGYTMLLEWGHSIYFDNKGIKQNMSSLNIPNILFKQKELTLPTKIVGPEEFGSITLDLKTFKINDFVKLDKNAQKSLATSLGKTVGELESTLTDPGYATKLRIALGENKKKTGGNYDAMLAKVQNFSWSLNDDLSYNITLDLISVGDIIDSLKMNFGGTQLTNTAVNNVSTGAGLRNFANIKLQSGASAFNSFLFELVQVVGDPKVKEALSSATQAAIENLDKGLLLEPKLDDIKKAFSKAIENYRNNNVDTYLDIQALLLTAPKVSPMGIRDRTRTGTVYGTVYRWSGDRKKLRELLSKNKELTRRFLSGTIDTLSYGDGGLPREFFGTFNINATQPELQVRNLKVGEEGMPFELTKRDTVNSATPFGVAFNAAPKINAIETFFARLKVDVEDPNFQLIDFLDKNKTPENKALKVIENLVKERAFDDEKYLKLDDYL